MKRKGATLEGTLVCQKTPSLVEEFAKGSPDRSWQEKAVHCQQGMVTLSQESVWIEEGRDSWAGCL